MFYKIIKNFFLKKNVKKRLLNQPPISKQEKIKTIGLLVDESYFSKTASLVDEILQHGFKKEQVVVLVYKDKIKSKEIINDPCVSRKDISISGEINKPEVNQFLDKPFDLLINYYDVNKFPIMLLSIKSKANFKVGFETVDKRVSHFIIKEFVDNYKEFTFELFKYLKILNKI